MRSWSPTAARAGSVLLFLSLLPGCGSQLVEFKKGSPPSTNVAPTVVSALPLAGSSSVALASNVSATFSKPMNAATIDATTFSVKRGSTSVAGTVTYSAGSMTATFAPTSPLSNSQTYTATVTSGAKDTTALALTSNYTWSFSTGGAPMVLSTTPLNGAANISLNSKPTATFSKPMNPTTINSLTFQVKQGLTPVSGIVTLNAATNTATFTPAALLGLDMLYTATITTGAKDTGNTALLADYVWTFRTGACSMAPVVLSSAGTFAVLAGSTVTNTGLTQIIGDVGTSPGTAITGFGPGIIVGAQHAGDPAAAGGIASLTTAYNDAAGRSLCAVTVAGNLGGLTLAPGLYKSTSTLAISSGDLTLDAQGDPDAIWIFQMASSLTTTDGRQVILTNGAKASNIYWQVGSSATIGTTSSFYGTIMADQAISLLTGATLEGRALARIDSVTMDSNSITRPSP